MSESRPSEATVDQSEPLTPLPPQATAGRFPVVGIGASAGGLEACRKLVAGLRADTWLACILVQHLDPTHESMMVDLLANHTSMLVKQAEDGMPIEPGSLYVIPPGTYLSAADGSLHLSKPLARHGARLPFDFLLQSLATEYGPRATCVILSGTGEDGRRGLLAIKQKGGRVIVQDPVEAGYDGMPKSAIATGSVDLVLPVARIADALISRSAWTAGGAAPASIRIVDIPDDGLAEVIELLRRRTPHDFTQYRTGTLQRRIERRIAAAGIARGDLKRYIEVLDGNQAELDLLANDLLINVTRFFRDPKVFDLLAANVIPDLVARQAPDQPLRVWVVGCSTGEETYSLVMAFRDHIATARPGLKLQVFASDVDADAVATAREGIYPETIAEDVSPERLARFFVREGRGYRISSEIRANVVFAVQDVLSDPPFSRLDMISCRNMLIYLLPDAQAKVIGLFHLALRENGILLLGSSETIGNVDGKFEVIFKAERIYRHIGRSMTGDIRIPAVGTDGVRVTRHQGPAQIGSSPAALADLCRRLVIENFAPAAILINQKHECLFSVGPTDRYLRVVPGHPVNDLLSMARDTVRAKLREAIQLAGRNKARVTISGGRIARDESTASFSIAVQPVTYDGASLLLVCFIDDPEQPAKRGRVAGPRDMPRIDELEHELEATRVELQNAVRDLEIANQEQRAMSEEASSVAEEYQSTNEELMTSKEELQSLNEELAALNNQLHETLDRQRTLSNDLQNILYSTDLATIFLDTDLKIHFFTPATKFLFSIIPSDVGRPLADLSSLANDGALLDDARRVLQSLSPIEREVQALTGAWYMRRVLPYRTRGDGVEGVVVIFSDVTERRLTADALEAAEKRAQQANIAKSRFLAAASHDLRQPLQAVALLQGLLAKTVAGEKAQRLVARLDDALGAMSGMLNTLLDINQIEAGTIQADIVSFSINQILDKIRDEYIYLAQAQKLSLRVIPCRLSVLSDPVLLGQMIRNLLSNALKYTKTGRILIGCRRHDEMVRIEVWDTGIGIADEELQAIFDEYHQVGNSARERSLGLGLGLSIVQRLGTLLGHQVRVRSNPGKGSVFTIDVALRPADALPQPHGLQDGSAGDKIEAIRKTGVILVIEDDPEVSELLKLYLKDDGHQVASVLDGDGALAFVARGDVRPDLILADYNLPGTMDGLQVTARIRELMGTPTPVIILTGDISSSTLRAIVLEQCTQLNKPVKLKELTQVIQRLLPDSRLAVVPPAERTPVEAGVPGASVVYVVDDDGALRSIMRETLEGDGHTVEDYETCEAFLEAYRPGREECLLIDAYLPGMSGLELLQQLHDAGHKLPAIMITGHSDVTMAVQAMKSGASDFIEKPVASEDLLAIVARALEQSRDSSKQFAWREAAANHIAGLTPRQREIMEMVLAGHPSKNIAADLHISQRTVENHRAAIMKKTGSKSLPALARLALAAV